MTRTDVSRGELYWLDWSPGGSEQSGTRPALVVAADAANRNSRYNMTIVVPVSSTRRDIVTHVPLEPSSVTGLTRRCAAKCEQVVTVTKDRLAGRIGRIDAATLERVDIALKRALGLR